MLKAMENNTTIQIKANRAKVEAKNRWGYTMLYILENGDFLKTEFNGTIKNINTKKTTIIETGKPYLLTIKKDWGGYRVEKEEKL